MPSSSSFRAAPISMRPIRPILSVRSRVRFRGRFSATTRAKTMRNFDMKTREITDTDLELVSAAGDFGAAVAGGLAGAIVGSIVGGGVGGVIAAAVSGAA